MERTIPCNDGSLFLGGGGGGGGVVVECAVPGVGEGEGEGEGDCVCCDDGDGIDDVVKGGGNVCEEGEVAGWRVGGGGAGARERGSSRVCW